MFLLERDDAGTLVHSASDLVTAGECEFRLLRRLDELLGRSPRRPREEDAMLARTAALGEDHERRVLAAHVRAHGRAEPGRAGGVLEVAPARRMSWADLTDAHSRTLAALEQGADVVYQASFFDGRFHGRADFLVRDPLAGPLRYAVHDSKLARRTKVRALLQLAAYADQLTAARVDPTDQVHLVLGTGETTSHRLADLMPVFRRRRARLLDVLESHVADDAPVRWDDERYLACGRLRDCPDCAEAAAAQRDVLLVGGVYGRQRLRLAAAGITTIDALATADEPPDGMAAGRFADLRAQARLQLGLDDGDGSVALDGLPDGTDPDGPDARLRWQLIGTEAIDRLPAPSPGDVFFDFEGDPLWEAGRLPGDDQAPAMGLDYLFGWVERPGPGDVRPPFHGLWADDLAGERDALVRFVDYLTERRATYPDLHVYHYAAYEKTHLLSIAARHGVYEDEVDQLLRDGVLVDLYAVVRSCLRISNRSKSIKRLEPLYMQDDPAREGSRAPRRRSRSTPSTRSWRPRGTSARRACGSASSTTTSTTAARRSGCWSGCGPPGRRRGPGRRRARTRSRTRLRLRRREPNRAARPLRSRPMTPRPRGPRHGARAATDGSRWARRSPHGWGRTGGAVARGAGAGPAGCRGRLLPARDEAVLAGALRPAGAAPGRVARPPVDVPRGTNDRAAGLGRGGPGPPTDAGSRARGPHAGRVAGRRVRPRRGRRRACAVRPAGAARGAAPRCGRADRARRARGAPRWPDRGGARPGRG
nr:hypothetical protein GCM10025730_33220 [Promicromonospora thailandica]